MKRRWVAVTALLAVSLGFPLAGANSQTPWTTESRQEGWVGVDSTAFLRHSFRPDPLDREGWETLRFGNTQTWDPALKGQVDRFGGWITPEDYQHLVLPPPPANSSAQTRAELDYLLDLRPLRDAEARRCIEDEIPLSNFWVPESIRAAGGPAQFPATERLVMEVMAQAQPAVMSFKSRFDRVRPHFLSPQIDPTIDVPSHPAYPSGHATQSHIVAYLLVELDPARTDEYLDRAREIAWHRELAGVHYPSDSFAGVLLAPKPTAKAQLMEASS